MSDVARAAQWYIDVLGFEKLYDKLWNGVPTFVGTGGTGLALFPRRERDGGFTADGIRHVAFRTNRENFQLAQHELKRRGIAFEFEDHEIAHSIYFGDPDGNRLEITTYELSRRS